MEFRNFCETLLQTGPVLQVKYMVKRLEHSVDDEKTERKAESSFFSRKIFNLDFLENTLVGFPKIFLSERSTGGLPGTLGRFRFLGLNVEKMGYMQDALRHHCVAMVMPISVKQTFLKSLFNV